MFSKCSVGNILHHNYSLVSVLQKPEKPDQIHMLHLCQHSDLALKLHTQMLVIQALKGRTKKARHRKIARLSNLLLAKQNKKMNTFINLFGALNSNFRAVW